MTATCSHPLILARMVNRFAVLANIDRIRILLRLSQGECGMKCLCAVLRLTPSSLSHHVDLLKRAGFVEVRHLGTQSLCRVRDSSSLAVLASAAKGTLPDECLDEHVMHTSQPCMCGTIKEFRR